MTTRPTDTHDPHFLDKLDLFVHQLHQDEVYSKVHDEWATLAAAWKARNQHNKEMSLPIELPPVLPTMTIWHDDGTVDHPPFPDLKIPALDSTASTGTIGFRPPGQVLPLTQLDGIEMTQQLILHGLDQIKQALGI